ncbi:S1 family peptidase [uncultured Comamonas sp.]|uniref:S1 family peptidase n=1 Tax=uncultured Comamonas sp. TaxID=114710 RepID=UPI0037488055
MKLRAITLALAIPISAIAGLDESQYLFNSKDQALKAAGLDIYESEKNTKVIGAVSENIKNISAEIYAGTWIEYDENNDAKQFIGVSSIRDLNKNIAQDNNVKILLHKYSYQELEGWRQKIWELTKEYNLSDESLILNIAIDDQRNKILVRTREENLDFVRNFLNSNLGQNESVIVESQSGPITLYGNIYGGTKIASFLPNQPRTRGGSSCTAGFNVIIDGVYQGTLTAAHCKHQGPLSWTSVYFNQSSAANVVQKGEYIGEYLADEFDSGIDAILFGNVSHVHSTSGRYWGPYGSLRTVLPLAAPVQNSTVCSFGGTSGWRCGTQMSVNSQQWFNWKMFNLSEAKFCGAPGDSGGPVVNANGNALGLYTGVMGDRSKGTCGPSLGGSLKPNSVYQPLGRYLSIYRNVQLQLR